MNYENSIKVKPSSIYILKGKWSPRVTVEDLYPNIESPSVIWKSSNPEIVYVDKYSGFMYGKEKGETTVYAISQKNNKIFDYCNVFVKQNSIPIAYMSLDRMCLNLKEKETYRFKLNISPENATNKKIKWFSSNENIATVDNGIVYAKTQGTAKIMAIAEKGGQTAICLLTVIGENPITSIEIKPKYKTLSLGKSAYLKAEIYPPYASNKGIYWCSGRPSIVSVDSNSGKITANSIGNAMIYATSKDGSYKQDICYVTVNKKAKGKEE